MWIQFQIHSPMKNIFIEMLASTNYNKIKGNRNYTTSFIMTLTKYQDLIRIYGYNLTARVSAIIIFEK